MTMTGSGAEGAAPVPGLSGEAAGSGRRTRGNPVDPDSADAGVDVTGAGAADALQGTGGGAGSSAGGPGAADGDSDIGPHEQAPSRG